VTERNPASGAWHQHSRVKSRSVPLPDPQQVLGRLACAGIMSTSLEIAAAHLNRGELVRVLAPWNVGRPSVCAALPSRKFTPQRVRVLLDYLATQAQAMLADIEAAQPAAAQRGGDARC
jgi:DNA-binding transcriptional LysR family regulator